MAGKTDLEYQVVGFLVVSAGGIHICLTDFTGLSDYSFEPQVLTGSPDATSIRSNFLRS